MNAHEEVRMTLDKYQDLLEGLMENRGLSKEEASARAFRIIRKTKVRFRCMECGNLIPKNGAHCRGCGSYDIDAA